MDLCFDQMIDFCVYWPLTYHHTGVLVKELGSTLSEGSRLSAFSGEAFIILTSYAVILQPLSTIQSNHRIPHGFLLFFDLSPDAVTLQPDHFLV